MSVPQLDVACTFAWITGAADAVAGHRAELTALDAAIGDGDHGENLTRGLRAVVAALEDQTPATVGAVLTRCGSTLISKVGGASGPLYGTAFRGLGKRLDVPEADPAAFAAAWEGALADLARIGRSQAGQKTMLDALLPAQAAFAAAAGAGADFAAAAAAAGAAASEGAAATDPMVAQRGRASYLGPRSAGHRDPGAASSALIVAALAAAVGGGAAAP